ncbi:DNA replication/repair protein RecF [Prolixibacteraceae bacterium JC049]|nr:DNA replication/repair protein RecF [Prolixibacteraceae bacterium JC049]
MYIKQLSLVNYKNFEQADLTFSTNLNCFIGDNGVGKTNLLDSIYYLSFCKSCFNSLEALNIRHGEEFFVLQGTYSRNDSEEAIYCGLKKGQKKQFKRNKKEYKKLAEHIGLLPLVMVSPSDINLILGGSDERRRFMDGVISQYDREYLEVLLKYNRTLLQRNNLLKKMAEGMMRFDPMNLEVWDEQLIRFGTIIHEKRHQFLKRLLPIFQHYYQTISQGKEEVQLIYKSQLNDEKFDSLLSLAIGKDRIVQHTSVGIHKDDLELTLGEYPIRKLGSQGQRKTYLVALKLAQYDFIRQVSGLKPILLLDDIFDKLDSNRVEQIVHLTASDNFGQIFITDTNREHLDQIIEETGADHRIFQVENGTVK